MYSEDVNYWQSSKSSPDSWPEKVKKEIRTAGGQVVGGRSFSEDITGRAGFMLAFNLEGESFIIKWPALPSKRNNFV